MIIKHFYDCNAFFCTPFLGSLILPFKEKNCRKSEKSLTYSICSNFSDGVPFSEIKKTEKKKSGKFLKTKIERTFSDALD